MLQTFCKNSISSSSSYFLEEPHLLLLLLSSPMLQALGSALPHCLLLAMPSAPQTSGAARESCRLCSRQGEDKVVSLVQKQRCCPSTSLQELHWARPTRVQNVQVCLSMRDALPHAREWDQADITPSSSTSQSLAEFVCEEHCTSFTACFVLRNISQLRKEKKYSCHELCLQTLSPFLAVEFISGALAPSCSPRMKRSVVLVVSN